MEVKRLGEILIKAGPQPALFLAAAFVRGQGDRFFPGLSLFCLHHQVEAGAIGEPDVAHEHIKTQILQEAQSVLHVARTRNFVAAMNQQIRENDTAIFVVFDEQDIHTP